jgi:hypothetical protein
MLTTIRRYLEHHHTASLADIARHLDADPAAVEGMIDQWIRKGKVSEVPVACGGCTQCDLAAVKTYRWLDRAAPRRRSSSVTTAIIAGAESADPEEGDPAASGQPVGIRWPERHPRHRSGRERDNALMPEPGRCQSMAFHASGITGTPQPGS